MDSCAGFRQPLGIIVDVVADEVCHGHIAMAQRMSELPARNSADVLLELRDRRAVERPVTRIMDPRRDFIDQQSRAVFSRHHKHLHTQHADIVQRIGDAGGDVAGLRGERIGDRSRHVRCF